MGSSPYKMFGFDYMGAAHSPCPPNQFSRHFAMSPAFNFNDISSYRRGYDQSYFFNPCSNPPSVNKRDYGQQNNPK